MDLSATVSATVAALTAIVNYLRARREASDQWDTLKRIESQTNGVLEMKIRRAVSQVLDEHPGLVTAAEVQDALAQLLEQRLAEGDDRAEPA